MLGNAKDKRRSLTLDNAEINKIVNFGDREINVSWYSGVPSIPKSEKIMETVDKTRELKTGEPKTRELKCIQCGKSGADVLESGSTEAFCSHSCYKEYKGKPAISDDNKEHAKYFSAKGEFMSKTQEEMKLSIKQVADKIRELRDYEINARNCYKAKFGHLDDMSKLVKQETKERKSVKQEWDDLRKDIRKWIKLNLSDAAIVKRVKSEDEEFGTGVMTVEFIEKELKTVKEMMG